jgi:mono/diheme cytochrome c family protein
VKPIAALLAVLVLALGAAACGGDDDDGNGAQPPPAGTTEADGESVFTENCGSCHVLEAAGTSGTIGPNLDEVQPDQATVEEQVRNGGGGMPAFEGKLTEEQIDAVAEYVATSAGG